MRGRRRRNIFDNIDWWMILIYLALVMIGWVSIYSAVYNPEHSSIFDLSQQYGKQLLWIGASIIIGVIVLIIDGKFYTSFAYGIYGFLIVMLIGVLIFGTEIKGAKSWFRIGSFAIQPAEFAKFATSLAIAKYLGSLRVKMKRFKTKAYVMAIIAFPALLILMQNDTGSMLVYAGFIIVLFREGLSGKVLVAGLYAAFLFIMVLIFRNESYELPFINYVLSGHYLVIAGLILLAGIFVYAMRKIKHSWLGIALVLVLSSGFVLSVDYIFENVLSEHQSKRINVLLGLQSDPQGSGYNVNQSLIAIGSGGFTGKGFLQGTQTKYDFVPEQSTDFIFCTIGEEFGFLGTMVVVALFLTMLLRIIFLAERQRSKFSRVYGYCVASVLFFHIVINIGMTIGLAPVIGIPLPFISYGGSSLWAFTILLFIFIKLDAERLHVLR